MATEYKLRLRFTVREGGTKVWEYKYAEINAEASEVSNLMNVMIANNSVFKYPPLTKHSAELVATTITEYDVTSGS